MYESTPSSSSTDSAKVIVADANIEALVIDDAHLLFAGDYSRSGDDLLITSELNQITIIDYFGSEGGQDLRNVDGANLSFNAIKALAGPESPAAYAVEGDVSTDLVEIGKVISLSGQAFSKSVNGIEVELKLEDPVFEGDVVRTLDDSDLGITFVDKTVFSLSSNATMILDELVYNAAGDAANSMAFNLVQGAFVFVTGEIAPTGNMSIETPVATMGIRGTTPTVTINADLGVTEFSILPDPGTEKVGSYVLVSKLDGQILGTVNSIGSKWVLTSLTGEAVEIGKTGIDLLEDKVALDKIRDVFTKAISDRADIDGSNSFGNVNSDVALLGDDSNDEGDSAEEVVSDESLEDLASVGDTDDKPIAFADFFTTNEDSVLINANVITGGNSQSDYDPDGRPVFVTHVDGGILTFESVNGFAKPVDIVVLKSGAILAITADGDITYDANDKFDFLGIDETGVGETDIDHFSYTITDEFGYTATATVAITLVGSNDQPIITNLETTKHLDTFTEQPDTTNDTITTQNAFGTVNFEDVDVSDTHTTSALTPVVTWNADNEVVTLLPPIGNIELILTETDPETNPVITFNEDGTVLSVPPAVKGNVAWEYTVQDNEIDFLAEGETLEIVYKILITDDSNVGDGSGTNEPETITQNVTIIVTGTNDAPVITVLDPADIIGTVTDVAEAANETPANSTGDLNTAGSITFADVDLTDRPTATEATKSVVWLAADGVTELDSSAHIAAIEAAFTIAADSGNTNDGSINWDYTIAESSIDFLGAGEEVTAIFTITVTDDEGATDTQDVTITLVGTNEDDATGDAPVITAVVVAGTVTDVAEAANQTPANSTGDLNTAGSITFADVDLTDRPTATEATKSVVWLASDGVTELDSSAHDAAIEAAFTLPAVVGNTNDGTINWDYTIAESSVDFLGAGEEVTAIFTITVTDDEGATDTQDVTITLVGTNDAPVITAVVVAGTVTDVAEAANQTPANSTGDLNTAGSITFADVDLTDRPTATEATKSVVWLASDGVTELDSSAHDAAIEAAFTLPAVVGNTNDGTINWDYTIAESSVDFLGAGEEVTAIFTITVTDDEGATDTQDVTITLVGTNDAPVITAVVVAGTVTDVAEAANQTPANSTGDLNTAGSITFADVDLTDRPTATEATKSVVWLASDGVTELDSSAHDAAIEAAFTLPAVVGNTNDGTINWDYTIAESSVDFLGAGEEVTAIFTITVTDDEGATDTQDVTITLVGTNDAPVITAVVVAGTVTDVAEAANQTPANSTGDLNTAGSITFADVDLTDRPTATEATKSVVWLASDGVTELDSSAHDAAIEAAFTLPAVVGNTNDGTINWDYTIAESSVDFLGAGEEVTAIFTITVTDDEGATDTQDVTITLVGTNDAPVITAVVVAGTVTDVAEAANQTPANSTGDLNTAGSITFADVDLTDRPTATEATKSVVWLASDGVTELDSSAHDAAIEAAFTLPAVVGNTNDGTINWDYTIAESSVDFLGAGEEVTAIFTITVTDDEGATDTQDVTITLVGTNDAPVITAVVVAGTVTDVAEAANQTPANSTGDLNTAGSITFADVDLTDRPTATEATKSVVWLASDGVTELDSSAHDAAIEAAFTLPAVVGNTNDGTINWDYTIAESSVDFLGAGEEVTAIFTITVTDDEGATDTQDVTITLVGTNDAPVITAVVVAGTVTDVAEAANQTPANSTGDLNTAGSITFADVDLTDRPTATEATKSVVWLASDGVTELDSSAHDAAIEAAFTLPAVVGNTNDGTINWDYTIAESSVDFLGAGEEVTAIFTITVTDDEGATDTQDVTITLVGTNDAPVITAVVVAGTVTDVAEAANQTPANSTGDLNTAGSITFADVDLTDRPTATEATKSVVWLASDGVTELDSSAHDEAIEAAFTLPAVVGNTNDGTINWDYTIAESSVDFLGAGEEVTAIFTITVTDDEGATDTQDVTITLVGTNDAPVITAVVVAGTVTDVAEAANQTPANSTGDLNTAGSITFADVDLTDRPTATEATKSVVWLASDGVTELDSSAHDAAIEAAFTLPAVVGNTNDGTINWDYTIAESSVDFLGAGEEVTAIFTITVTDDEGATDTQDVTITLVGTNDAPVITAVVVAGTVTDVAEAANQTPANSTGDLNTAGSITFADVDLTDRPTATEATKSVVWLASDGVTELDSSAHDEAIEAAFTLPAVVGNTNDGTINWDYTIAESSVDFLGAGEEVTAIFTITVTDDEGATDTQDVTITLVGTNDAPVITAVVVAGTVTDVAEAANQTPANSTGDLNTAGSITFADVDLTDRPTATEATKSVVWLASDGVTELDSSAHDAAIEAAFTLPAVVGNTNDGTINWDYTIAESSVDFLGAGEEVTAIFTITVTDDEGATDTQDVTITLVGTNDAPVITAVVVAGTVTDVAEAANQTPANSTGDLNTAGSITFADVDLTDRPTATEATKSVVWLASDGVTELDSSAHDAAIEAAFTLPAVVGNTNDGTINWDYTIAESSVDFLGAGEEVTAIFTITVTDDEGATDTQDVTITLVGTNDAPVITSLAGDMITTGTITEIDDGALGENATPLTDTGTITFADVDLTDGHTVSVTNTNSTHTSVLGALVPVIGTASTGTGSGTIDWTYTVADGAIDFLDTIDTVTETFEITLDDGNGGTTTATVEVVIQGKNDAPIVTVSGDEVSAQAGSYGYGYGYGYDYDSVIVDSNFTVTDENDILESATMVITNKADFDFLLFEDNNLDDNITGYFDDASGTLTLTGDDSAEMYEAALSSVEFSANGFSLDDRTVVIETTVWDDGGSISNTGISTIQVIASEMYIS